MLDIRLRETKECLAGTSKDVKAKMEAASAMAAQPRQRVLRNRMGSSSQEVASNATVGNPGRGGGWMDGWHAHQGGD